MKVCLFLCAAAALAAQDVAPPVISLTLDAPMDNCTDLAASFATKSSNNAKSWDWDNRGYQALNCPAPCHKCENAARDNDRAQSVTCEVQTNLHGQSSGSYDDGSVNVCPEPRCTVYDHYENRERGHAPPQCAEDYFLVNDNGLTVNSHVTGGIDRALRSEWLIRYSAADRAGNAADNVTFTMIFADTQAPELTTEFGHSGPSYDRQTTYPSARGPFTCDGNSYYSGCSLDHDPYMSNPVATNVDQSWLQSCSLTNAVSSGDFVDTDRNCDNNLAAAFNGASPCVYTLKSNLIRIRDNYDAEADIKDSIKASIWYKETYGGGWTRQDGASGDPLKPWNSTDLTIDTQKTGDWQVRYEAKDEAGIFGYLEADNVVTQIVDFTVSDDVKPVVTLNAHHQVGSMLQRPNSGASQAAYSDADPTACTYTNGNSDYNITLECRKPTACRNAVASYAAEDNECGSFYSEPGALCKDLRSSWNATSGAWEFDDAVVSGKDMAVEGSRMNKLTSDNEHVVVYTCAESLAYGGASADRSSIAHRTITVQDRIAPAVVLKGQTMIQNSAGSHNGNTDGAVTNAPHDGDDSYENTDGSGNGYFLDMNSLLAFNNAECSDLCNPSPQITLNLIHGSDCTGSKVTGDNPDGSVFNFPEHTPGDYSIQYTCHDSTGGTVTNDNTTHADPVGGRTSLSTSVCLHIENVDKTKPIIQVLGSNVMTLEATHQGNYVDDGATCWDRVDGVISQNVEVSGDVVNLSKVGTYVIQYNCKDSAGQDADPITRTVYIAQTTCPRCTMAGCDGVHDTADWNCTTVHEASFAYTDPSVTCADDIDGSVATVKTADVDVDIETTGTYVLTYRAKNTAGLWNDEVTCDNGATNYFRTVIIADTLVPVVQITFKGKEVGRSDATDTAVHNGAANPAAAKNFQQLNIDSHPLGYMAEEQAQQSGAWVIGAIASSVAGLALLASSRKRSASLTVPV